MTDIDNLLDFLNSQRWVIKPVIYRLYNDKNIDEYIITVETTISSVYILTEIEEKLKKDFIKDQNIKLFLRGDF